MKTPDQKEWDKLMLQYQRQELDSKLRRIIEVIVLLLISVLIFVSIFDK